MCVSYLCNIAHWEGAEYVANNIFVFRWPKLQSQTNTKRKKQKTKEEKISKENKQNKEGKCKLLGSMSSNSKLFRIVFFL